MIQFLGVSGFGVLRATLPAVVAIFAIAQGDGQNLVLLHANTELIGELFEDGQTTFVAGDFFRRDYGERCQPMGGTCDGLPGTFRSMLVDLYSFRSSRRQHVASRSRIVRR